MIQIDLYISMFKATIKALAHKAALRLVDNDMGCWAPILDVPRKPTTLSFIQSNTTFQDQEYR
jgi:hypothetical protein